METDASARTPDGDTMVLALVHQAMLEGVSGIDLMLVLHDLKPESGHGSPPRASWEPEAIPDAVTLMQEAVRDRMTEVVEWWPSIVSRSFALRSKARGQRG